MSFEHIRPEDNEAALLERYDQMRLAIPFPKLDWGTAGAERHSLELLRNYAERMGYGAIDWYIEKKRSKKFWALFLHLATYLFAGLAAIGPLLKLGAVFELSIFRDIFPPGNNYNAAVAEIALLFAGIAGGFNLLDRSGGYSDDWMRYMTTAAQVNKALVTFQFKWERIEREAHPSNATPDRPVPIQPEADPNQDPGAVAHQTPARPEADAAPLPSGSVGALVEHANDFCLEVIEIVGNETAVWVNAMVQRMGRAEISLMRTSQWHQTSGRAPSIASPPPTTSGSSGEKG